MTTNTIKAGSLGIMSGLPGAGKSTILKNSKLAPGVVISSDHLRRTFAGESMFIDVDGHKVIEPLSTMGVLVWQTLERVVEERLKQGLTTIVDATLVADCIPGTADRALFAGLAQKHNVPFQVFIVDTPMADLIEQNRCRDGRVPTDVIDSFVSGTVVPATKSMAEHVVGAYENTSKFPHTVLSADATIEVVPPLMLDGTAWDVFGDVHGMLDELKMLMEKMGYEEQADGLYRHPDGRRMLFEGDVVDRGPFSLQALEFIMRHVKAGIAKCIAGNHDKNLVKFWDAYQSGQLDSWKSYATAQSGMELLNLPKLLAEQLVQFIREMPLFAVYEGETKRVVFAHADARSFHVSRSGADELLHGCSNRGKFDSDAAMQRWMETMDIYSTEPGGSPPTKEQFYVRGHIPATSWQSHVLSLEAHAFQRGALLALRLDAFLDGRTMYLMSQPTSYDFEAVQAERVQAFRELQSLVRNKLATATIQQGTGLRLFKYAGTVFYDRKWSEDEALRRARGHVYDIAGNIVSNPFDKVFNYQEEGAGLELTPETEVMGVEKVNGFLGVISPHPLKKGELLVHTTGTFDSKFVGFINDFVTGPLKGRMAKLFHARPLTLMMEVVHPEDPHVVKYEPEEQGLYLIGARAISVGSAMLTEEELDELAANLQLRRPGYKKTTFGQLMDEVKTCKHEGFMVRLLDEPQTTVLKLKGKRYLTSKFLGRMKEGKWKFLFANPDAFKKGNDEEFFTLIDKLKSNYTLEYLQGLTEQEKHELIRQLVN